MQAGDRAIVFDADQQRAALGVGQTDDRLQQVCIRERPAVALELDGQRFARGDERAQFSFIHHYPTFPYRNTPASCSGVMFTFTPSSNTGS